MQHHNTQQTSYIGRFAPSPTGDLHLGSLVTALASYLDAKAHAGQWLVRMENIDPPRETPGAANRILHSLEAHHLHWDQTVLSQSDRNKAYQAAIDELSQYCYECSCTRKRLLSLDGGYDGHCLHSTHQQSKQTAIRLKVNQLNPAQQARAENFEDAFLGRQLFPLCEVGDMIIRRKDGLFAYQLAVAVDDIFQNITHVIRGCDLIESTSRQRYIMLLLQSLKHSNNSNLPLYGHSPLVLGSDGMKLSKQNKAPPLIDKRASDNLIEALSILNHPPPIKDFNSLDCKTLLEWATENWQRDNLPRHSELAPGLTDA